MGLVLDHGSLGLGGGGSSPSGRCCCSPGTFFSALLRPLPRSASCHFYTITITAAAHSHLLSLIFSFPFFCSSPLNPNPTRPGLTRHDTTRHDTPQTETNTTNSRITPSQQNDGNQSERRNATNQVLCSPVPLSTPPAAPGHYSTASTPGLYSSELQYILFRHISSSSLFIYHSPPLSPSLVTSRRGTRESTVGNRIDAATPARRRREREPRRRNV